MLYLSGLTFIRSPGALRVVSLSLRAPSFAIAQKIYEEWVFQLDDEVILRGQRSAGKPLHTDIGELSVCVASCVLKTSTDSSLAPMEGVGVPQESRKELV